MTEEFSAMTRHPLGKAWLEGTVVIPSCDSHSVQHAVPPLSGLVMRICAFIIHTSPSSQEGHTPHLTSCYQHLEILNDAVFELVFCI